MSSLDDRVDALFTDLPTDPQQRLDAVAGLYAAIRERAAKHLEPAVRQILQGAGELSYEQKVQTSRKINHVLQDARLGIADPATDLPARLIPNRSRPGSTSSRFYLQDRKPAPDGQRHSAHLKPQDVSAIRLMSTRPDDDDPPERPGRSR